MQQNGWKIIFEDGEILVVCKEPGLAVQSGNLRQTDLVSRLRNYRKEKGEEAEIFPVHRLDQPVGGILVFAKTKHAAAELGLQIQQNKMEKYYRAVTEGETEESAHLENYLEHDRRSGLARIAGQNSKNAKKAVLDYRRLAQKDGRSLLEIRLETGRFHQIRAQMAANGHPVCGDLKYNPNAVFSKESREKSFPALFAWRLKFRHPASRKELMFEEIPNYGFFRDFSDVSYK